MVGPYARTQDEEQQAQELLFGSLRQATQNGPNLFNTMISEKKTVATPDARHAEPCLRPPDCMIPTPLAIYYA